jgi:acetyl-CoA C-acetyltransferase
VGALIADWAGLGDIEALHIEAADASGAAAVHMGYLAVASGVADVVVACGVEKTTDADAQTAISAWASGTDADFEANQGLTMNALAGLLMRRYMWEFDVKPEAFSGFAVNAHANGANNPHAMYRSPISSQAYVKAGLVADPIGMFDVAPLCDGAAAVVLCASDHVGGARQLPIRVLASSVATDRLAVHSRRDTLHLHAAAASAQRAYEQADVGAHDIDLFELHDAYGILAALSLEACSFAQRGKGTELAQDGSITLQGPIPISTLGGLKARGHPLGATGVYQIVEVVTQLRGHAGKSQVNCDLGMAQNLGGSGGTAVTHILKAHR